jgi:hypothetical protein
MELSIAKGVTRYRKIAHEPTVVLDTPGAQSSPVCGW